MQSVKWWRILAAVCIYALGACICVLYIESIEMYFIGSLIECLSTLYIIKELIFRGE